MTQYIMTNEAVKRLRELKEFGDIEVAHILADDVLLGFAPPEVQEAYKEIKKWYA